MFGLANKWDLMACMKNHLKTNQKVPSHDCSIFLKINMAATQTNPNTY